MRSAALLLLRRPHLAELASYLPKLFSPPLSLIFIGPQPPEATMALLKFEPAERPGAPAREDRAPGERSRGALSRVLRRTCARRSRRARAGVRDGQGRRLSRAGASGVLRLLTRSSFRGVRRGLPPPIQPRRGPVSFFVTPDALLQRAEKSSNDNSILERTTPPPPQANTRSPTRMGEK